MNREKSKNEDIFNLNLIDEKDYYLTDKSENNNEEFEVFLLILNPKPININNKKLYNR